ncbi:MAG: penicillin acylase family protein [Burkholderia sp.]
MPRARAARALAGLDPNQLHVGGHYGIGSNGLAFGRDATGGEPILFGNPHGFWSGPDRFYQAQLTIPGQLDVSGASFLGVPVIMIGFNDQVAWTHTVSSARRFGVFQLQLADDDPTQYLVDGRRVAMRPVTLTVPVRQPGGTLGGVTRTLYTTPIRAGGRPVVMVAGLDACAGFRAARREQRQPPDLPDLPRFRPGRLAGRLRRHAQDLGRDALGPIRW